MEYELTDMAPAMTTFDDMAEQHERSSEDDEDEMDSDGLL